MSNNPLTIEAFAEWAEKQPADKEFQYRDKETCACGQYAKAIGVLNWSVFGSDFWADADFEAFLCETPRAFGALAKRLRSLSA